MCVHESVSAWVQTCVYLCRHTCDVEFCVKMCCLLGEQRVPYLFYLCIFYYIILLFFPLFCDGVAFALYRVNISGVFVTHSRLFSIYIDLKRHDSDTGSL